MGTHKGKGLRFWGHTKEDERLNEIFNEDTQRKTEGEGIKILGTHKRKALKCWGRTKEDERLNGTFNEDTQ